MALPDGIYIGLDFAEYVAQPGRLGSTTKTTLHQHGAGLWWKSPMNPYYKEAQSPDMLEGEALHALMLEGEAVYEARFGVEPDKADYGDLLVTVSDIKEALRDASVAVPGSSAYKLEDWALQASVLLPERNVWHSIQADFAKTLSGRKSLSAETDFKLRAMYEAATEDNPETADVRELLSVGSRFPILAEVSVLYTDERGLRHRARFDKLLPTVITDLKSVGGWQGRPMVHMLDSLIKRSGYDIQEADYQIARAAGFKMILEDEAALHGGTLEERAHMLAMATFDQTHRPGWAWLFFQKPENTGRAPILFPVKDEWGGPYHRSGYRKRVRALDTYQELMARFGSHRPWSKVEPLHGTTENQSPRITQDHYGFDDNPVEGEADYFRDGEE